MNRWSRAARIGALKRAIYRDFLGGTSTVMLAMRYAPRLICLGLPRNLGQLQKPIEQIIREKAGG